MVVACSSPQEYVAAVLDLGEIGQSVGAPCFPILRESRASAPITRYPGREIPTHEYSPSSSLETTRGLDHLGLAGLLLERCRKSSGGAAAVALDLSSTTAIVGLAHALHASKEVRSFEGPASLRGIGDGGSLTLLLSRARLREIGLDAFVQALGKNGTASAAWGIWTGDDDSQLSVSVAKRHLDRGHSRPQARVYWMLDEAPPFGGDADFQVLACSPLETAELANLYSQPTPVAFFQGHGRSYCFSSGRLCTSDEEALARGRCVGSYQCIYRGSAKGNAIVSVKRLRADVVVLNTCSSSNLHSTGDGTNLVTHLLASTPGAVIAPHRLPLMHPLLAIVGWDQLRRGASLGGMTKALNALLAHDYNDVAQFVLFGDPESRPFSSQCHGELEVTPPKSSSAIAEYGLPPARRCVESFRIPASHEYPVHGFLGAEAGGVVQVLPDGEGCDRVLLSWPEAHPQRSSRVVITPIPPLPDALLTTADAILTHWDELFGSTLPDELDGDEGPDDADPQASARLELEAALRSLEPHLPGILGHPHKINVNAEELRRCRDDLERLILAANAGLLEEIWENGRFAIHFHSPYKATRGVRFLENRFVEAPRCGGCEGPLQRRLYRIGLRRPQLRSLCECERCDLVCDIHADLPILCLQGPQALAAGSSERYALEIENPLPVEAVVHARAGVVLPETDDSAPFELEVGGDGVFIPPGERQRIVCEVWAAPTVPRHRYRLQVYVCLNGRAGKASRSIVVQ